MSAENIANSMTVEQEWMTTKTAPLEYSAQLERARTNEREIQSECAKCGAQLRSSGHRCSRRASRRSTSMNSSNFANSQSSAILSDEPFTRRERAIYNNWDQMFPNATRRGNIPEAPPLIIDGRQVVAKT